MKSISGLKFFSIFGLFLAAFGSLALLLALTGFFHTVILAVFAFLSLGFLAYLAIINRKNFYPDWSGAGIVFLSLLAVIIFSYSSPTLSIFSGRDQGSFSEAAIRLSENHQLEFSTPASEEFFKIYGPGKALNFPGFNYTEKGNLITQFQTGYISWLAAWYSFFGLGGFSIANGITFLIFLVSFYLLAKSYASGRVAFAAWLLVATSFVFSWFLKYTLSENLALALVWFGILQFVVFLKNLPPHQLLQKKLSGKSSKQSEILSNKNDVYESWCGGKNQLHLLSFLASFGLLLFVRIESVAFLAMSVAILLAGRENRKQLLEKISKKIFFGASGFILLVFILSLKANSAFYITFAKGFLNSLDLYKSSAESPHFFAEALYVFRVFDAYALLQYLFLGAFGVIYFLKKKNFSRLIPLFIVLPAFIYLLNPGITLDHPWMLRRYVFAVVPAGIFCTVIFLDSFFKKRYFYVLVFLLLLINLSVSALYFGIAENRNLLPQIEKLGENFGENDLILVDRSATGDPWAMMSGPLSFLFEKQAVYFFNPEDLKKISLSQFEKVYFVIPDQNIDFYRNSDFFSSLIPIKDYVLENESLAIATGQKNELLKEPIRLPLYQKNYVYGKIYLLEK